ncbi:MAG: AbiH family protein [Sphaerochaeta sp.]|nr:AbiH family protein [Sphaerochaeta sp.]
MRYDAINNTRRLIENYYSNSAKKTTDVLEKYRSMFEALVDIEQIVVIGHSLSDVDHPYFEEIRETRIIPDGISGGTAQDLLRVLRLSLLQ